MSQGNWGGGGGGSGDGWGGQGGGAPPGGGYGPPPGGAPPGGYGPPQGGYGPPPGGGGYGPPPGGGGFAPPPAGYPPGYTPPNAAGAVAWEDASRGVISGWWDTFKDASFNPKAFFSGAAQNDNPWPSITFGMATGGLAGFLYGVFVAILYLAIGGMMAAALGGKSGFGGSSGSGGSAMMLGMMGAMGVGAIIIYPLMFAMSALIGPWISGGIYHLMLLLFRGATKPYTNTVRVSGYSNAATLWMVIPGLGGLVSIGFHLVLTVIGLDETHRCGIGKAIAAVVVPMVLVCGCCCVGYGMLFAAVGSNGHF